MLEEKRQTSALTWGVLETLGRAAVKLCLVLGLASAVSKMPGPPSPVPPRLVCPLGQLRGGLASGGSLGTEQPLFRAVTRCGGDVFQIGKGFSLSDKERMGQSKSESRHLFTNQTYLLLSLSGELG